MRRPQKGLHPERNRSDLFLHLHLLETLRLRPSGQFSHALYLYTFLIANTCDIQIVVW